jgi:hypothetical protein
MSNGDGMGNELLRPAKIRITRILGVRLLAEAIGQGVEPALLNIDWGRANGSCPAVSARLACREPCPKYEACRVV